MAPIALLALSALSAYPQRVGAQLRTAGGSQRGRRPDASVAHTADSGVMVTQVHVLVMVGSNGPGGLAANLRSYPQLTRAPFTAYRQIDRVSESTLSLSVTSPATVAIPNNGTVRVTLANEARSSGQFTVAVAITMGGRTHNTQFAARAGVPFFLAHSTGVDGALILRFELN